MTCLPISGQLRLQLLFIFWRFSIRWVIMSAACPASSAFQRFSMAVSASRMAVLMRLMAAVSRSASAGFRYRSGNPLNVAVSQQLPALSTTRSSIFLC